MRYLWENVSVIRRFSGFTQEVSTPRFNPVLPVTKIRLHLLENYPCPCIDANIRKIGIKCST